MSGRLRWKMSPRETGLRAILAGHRSREYTDGKTVYAMVTAHDVRHTGCEGWFWYTMSKFIPFKNTAADPALLLEEAKARAAAYVKEHLK